MKNLAHDAIIDQSITTAIDREELLLRKYEHYKDILEDAETSALLKECATSARDHIDMLKNTLQKLDL
ncbi:MAG: hypothetical protein H7Y41_01680 [Hyphomonadaceae bacterium]|nr:hypothetical protein [Clostridia bacterium]